MGPRKGEFWLGALALASFAFEESPEQEENAEELQEAETQISHSRVGHTGLRLGSAGMGSSRIRGFSKFGDKYLYWGHRS